MFSKRGWVRIRFTISNPRTKENLMLTFKIEGGCHRSSPQEPGNVYAAMCTLRIGNFEIRNVVPEAGSK